MKTASRNRIIMARIETPEAESTLKRYRSKSDGRIGTRQLASKLGANKQTSSTVAVSSTKLSRYPCLAPSAPSLSSCLPCPSTRTGELLQEKPNATDILAQPDDGEEENRAIKVF
uniref:Uncharacterized protein n=1 Tax=Arundo donax TaxID=35708 RepID=A0A0A9CK51_ARUDO